MRLLFKTCLQSPVSPALRQSRTAMTNNKDWQKFNLMSVFGSAPAIRHQFQLGITTYYPEQDRKDVDRWLVASTLGTKSARKMALEHKHRGWMPLASVAAHLSGTAGVAPDVDGHAFAFSKVSRTGLPVHVNAWFDVTDCLVGWSRDGDKQQRPAAPEEQASFDWNRELLACVVDAYLDLLTALPSVFQNDPALMYRLWPRSADVEGAFHHALHRPIFVELAKMQVFLLPNGQLSKMSGGPFLFARACACSPQCVAAGAVSLPPSLPPSLLPSLPPSLLPSLPPSLPPRGEGQ